jgi:hypothetical protein
MRASLAHAAASLFAWPVAQYIRHHRDTLAAMSHSLSADSKALLSPYFPSIDLDCVRIVEEDPLPVLGLRWTNTGAIQAMAFDHVIVARSPMGPALLFHELVHVIQYRLLGVHTFSRLYARGFLATESYHQIPLEQCAFELEDRFACEPTPFDVEVEVARWIHNRRF